MRRFAILLVFALAVAACGGGGSDDEGAVVVDAPDAADGAPAEPTEGDDPAPPDDVAPPDDSGSDDGLDAPLLLNGVGIQFSSGVLEFGTDAETVISRVTSALGPPTDDTGSIGTDAGCPTNSQTYRTVTWGDLELVFLSQSTFSDGPEEHLAFWFNPGNDVDAQAFIGDSTEVIITNDQTTVGDLQNALGTAVQVADEAPFGPSFVISDNFGEIRGEVTGLADADIVISTNGGIGCGE